MATLFSVAVSPPGNSHLNVVIADIQCDAGDALDSGVSWAHETVQALAAVHPTQWHARVISQTEVEDIEAKP